MDVQCRWHIWNGWDMIEHRGERIATRNLGWRTPQCVCIIFAQTSIANQKTIDVATFHFRSSAAELPHCGGQWHTPSPPIQSAYA